MSKAYFNDPLAYSLKSAVNTAGGNVNHYNLFNFLLKASLPAVELGTANSVILQDCRAGNSLLFVLPFYLQAGLSLILHQRELELYNLLEANYAITPHYIKPTEALLINQAITGNPMSPTLLSFLSKTELNRQALSYLIGLPTDLNIFDPELILSERLELLLNAYSLSGNFYTSYIELAVSNDRHTAGVYIAERLGYPLSATQAIANVIELWLLQNSSL